MSTLDVPQDKIEMKWIQSEMIEMIVCVFQLLEMGEFTLNGRKIAIILADAAYDKKDNCNKKHIFEERCSKKSIPSF